MSLFRAAGLSASLLAAACLAPATASAQAPSAIECVAYRAALAAGGASADALARGTREVDFSGLRDKVDAETGRAISRLEDANVNLQPPLAEWSAAATALAQRLKAICAL